MSPAQRVEARVIGGGGVALAAATSGTNQSSLQAQPQPAPVVVAVQDAHANPVAGVQVSFAVNGGGDVTPGSASSDASGEIRVSWTLGIPLGVRRLTATAQGLLVLEVMANATQAPPSAPTRIVMSSGDLQTVMQHGLLPMEPEVWVTDALGNGVPGVTVTFAPVAGGAFSEPARRSQPSRSATPAAMPGGAATFMRQARKRSRRASRRPSR